MGPFVYTAENPEGAPVALKTDEQGNLLTSDNGANDITWDDSESGTTTGDTQQIAAANAARKKIVVANLDPSATMYVRFGAAASAGPGSIPIGPGEVQPFSDGVDTRALNLYCATANLNFTVWEA